MYLSQTIANTAATITLTGAAGQRITVRGIYVKATGALATSTVTVQDGATTVLDLGTVSIPLAGATVQFTGAGGIGSVTTTSVIADRQ